MKKLLAPLVTVAVCAVLTLTSFVSAQNSGQNPSRRASDAGPAAVASDGRYVIQFHRYGPDGPAAVRAAGGEVIHEFPQYAAVAARLPEQALRGLQNNPNVKLIEVDPRRYPMQTTWADKVLASGETLPYGIQMVQADQLSDANAAARRVCIVDSGYYLNHPDLQDGSVTATYDSGTGDPFTDGDGHGTHVAGTIAAIGGNSAGVVGVLPNSKINLHIVKVFGDDGQWAYSSDLANALGKCRDAGSNVVSMSLGGSLKNGIEEQAFNDAYNAGLLSIAAAGNAGNTSTSYPAGYGSVVSVAAVDNTETVADFSQKNSDVEIAAPGVSVLSTVPYIETNALTVDGATYKGNYVENAARTAGVTGNLVNGGRCTATNGAWSGRVVLCERGDVSFFDKVMNVQNSGGAAAVIYNNVSGGFFGTLGDGNSSNIPAISLSQEDGQYLVANKLGAAGTVVSKVDKPASGYDYFNGTSMATPHVSAVAALVWSYDTGWTNAQVRDALNKTAKDKGAAGRDTSYGFGIVQAKAALDLLNASGGGGGGDITAPVITNVASRITNSKNGSFEITWTTDEASNSEVRFTKGATGTYTDSAMVTSHRMGFRGSKGVTYEYYVSSTDAAGNKATSGPHIHQN
jgi:serine protease